MTKKTLLIISIFFLALNTKVFSQFVDFTQYYASGLQLAPSFAGDDEKLRFTMQQKRTERLDGFLTNYFSMDWNAPRIKSGFGFTILRGELAGGIMYDTRFEGQYSFNARISKKWYFRPGIAFSFTSNTILFSETVFSDQIENLFSTGYLGTTSLYDFNEYEHLTYGDYKVSAVFHNDKLRFGFMIDHLKSPDQSYSLERSEMPRQYSFFGDYDFNLKKGEKDNLTQFSTTWVLNSQNSIRDIDLSLYWWLQNFAPGISVNGIPAVKQDLEMRRGIEGLSLIFLINFKALKIGYNYDFSLKRPIGFHEISLQFYIDLLFPSEEDE